MPVGWWGTCAGLSMEVVLGVTVGPAGDVLFYGAFVGLSIVCAMGKGVTGWVPVAPMWWVSGDGPEVGTCTGIMFHLWGRIVVIGVVDGGYKVGEYLSLGEPFTG